jgi:hypothetical protein
MLMLRGQKVSWQNAVHKFFSTTLLELKFGRQVLREEAQSEQFPNRFLPQPFTHPPMHRR